MEMGTKALLAADALFYSRPLLPLSFLDISFWHITILHCRLDTWERTGSEGVYGFEGNDICSMVFHWHDMAQSTFCALADGTWHAWEGDAG